MSDGQPVAILVADDHQVVAMGFAALLGADPHFTVGGIVTDADTAMARIDRERPGLVVASLRMRGGPAARWEELRDRCPGVGFLLYSHGVEEQTVIEAARFDPGGLVLTSSPPARLLAAARTVAAGGSFLDPSVAARLFDQVRQPGVVPAAPLTDTERALLGHLARGLTNREIAEHLYLSEKTVKNYVSRLVRKLGVRRIDLVDRAAASGPDRFADQGATAGERSPTVGG